MLLEADIRELRANKNRRASGVVIESALHRGRGAVATVLVQNGTLRVGDIVVAGGTFGKVRALIDDKGKQVKKAGPSIPVEVMGLSDVPAAGDVLSVVSDERVARETAEKRATRRRDVRMAATGSQRVSLETFMSMPAEGSKVLNLIIKADGQGSLEALRARMESLSTDDVEIRVIHGGVGAISPNDVNLASASNAVLIGFNIRPDETARRLAENEGVDLRFYQVIYEIEDDLKKAMRGMLSPVAREVILGRAEVRQVFKVSRVGTIVGCYVTNGKISRNAKARVIRDAAVVFDGEIESLRRFKDDVREVAEGFECGIQIARFQDLKEGDVIEALCRRTRRSGARPGVKPQRIAKIDHEIQRILGTLVSQELQDPRLAFVTVTRAEVTDDLRYCKVFVSVIGDRHQARQSLDALTACRAILARGARPEDRAPSHSRADLR